MAPAAESAAADSRRRNRPLLAIVIATGSSIRWFGDAYESMRGIAPKSVGGRALELKVPTGGLLRGRVFGINQVGPAIAQSACQSPVAEDLCGS